MSRTAEFVLGLIGGIIGAVWSAFWAFGGLAAIVGASNPDEGAGGVIITAISVFMVLMCAASIVFSIPSILKRNHKLAGGIMLATGIIGMFIGLVIFWLIPGTLLIIAGSLALRKPKNEEVVSHVIDG